MDWMGVLFKLLSLALVSIALGLSGYRIFKTLRSNRIDVANTRSNELTRSTIFPSKNGASAKYLSFLQIATLTLANRALIFLVAYLAYLGIAAGEPVGFFSPFQEIWGKWDTRHYLNIAENGYQREGEGRMLLVFYPLYPLTIKLAHLIVGNYFWAAITVSLTCLIAATYFLYRLVLLEFPDAVLARDTVKYLLIFPFSFFFSAAYTESLFLLLTVLTFYFCKRDYWFAAGLAGMLAALTRNQGLLLLLPLVIEFLYRYRCNKIGAIEFAKRAACILLVPLGFGIYLFINKWLSGEWFMFIKYQSEQWHNTFGFFANTIQTVFLHIFEPNIKWSLGTWLPEFSIFFVAALFIAASARKIAPSYIVYSIAYLVISYSPTSLISGPRYIAAMFPLFICMALFVRGHYIRQQLLDMTSFLLLGLYICMYPLTYTIF